MKAWSVNCSQGLLKNWYLSLGGDVAQLVSTCFECAKSGLDLQHHLGVAAHACDACIWEAGGAEGRPQLHAKFEAHLGKTETN